MAEGRGGDLRLEFSRAEDVAIMGSVKPPKVSIAEDEDVGIPTGVSYFGVGHAPVKAFCTWHTGAVKHPPENVRGSKRIIEEGARKQTCMCPCRTAYL